jgi:hypothetical protein
VILREFSMLFFYLYIPVDMAKLTVANVRPIEKDRVALEGRGLG